MLSLENFPNSESKEKILRFVSKNAFGKFSRISFKKKLSLDNFPNSGAKSPNSCFFQNLRTQGLGRVWRIFQTQVSKLRFCERTAGSHSFLLGPQGLDAFTCGCTCHDVKMKLSRLKCVSSLCSGHATVLNRWSRNRKLSHSSSTWRVSNRQSCTQFSFTAIAL